MVKQSLSSAWVGSLYIMEENLFVELSAVKCDLATSFMWESLTQIMSF